jgi:ATP synthase protein I
MKRPEPSTPRPDDAGRDPLAKLDSELASFEAKRWRQPTGLGGDAGLGYRLLGQMLGGVLGGIGLGWLVDHVGHTSPWGLVLGLLIGLGLSVYSTVRIASQAGARSESSPGSDVRPPADDDEDDV